MRNLSPQTRQKLAILLKSRAKQQGLSGGQANLTAPPAIGMKLPMPAPVSTPVPEAAEHMSQPQKFGLLKKRFKI